MRVGWKQYRHWIIAIIVGAAGLGTAAAIDTFNGRIFKDGDVIVASSQIQTFNVIAPYKNNGPDAKDDNFFTPGTFKTVTELRDQYKPTVVWISASWCETCHYMRPFIWQVANKYADKIVLKEIDFADNYKTIILPNYLFGTPTFLVLDTNGKVIHTFYGADEQGFDAELAKISGT